MIRRTMTLELKRMKDVSVRSLSRQMSAMTLRDYQEDCLTSVHNAISRGVRRPAVVLATGGGKTVVFSHLIPQLEPYTETQGSKTLVLAHKQELVYQAASKIASVNPNLKVAIDMHNMKPTEDADVIVGSVPTLVRMSRLEKYDPAEFKTIILDECHHATAKSWAKILNYFSADHKQSPIHVIGFTATMERADGSSLGKLFDEIVYERGLIEMVQNKELVDVKFSTLDVAVDFSKVKTRLNDFDTKSLSDAMNQDEINYSMAGSYLRLSHEFNFKSTLIFCVDIAHCKTLCGVLQSQGINAQYVTGDTVKHERVSILEDFKQGKIQVLCNVLVFTEGTDIPNIDSLFLARPTKSRPLLVQMIGRGLRLHEGKSHCHIVDVAGTRSIGIQSVPTLFGVPDSMKGSPRNYEKTQDEDEDELDTRLMSKEEIKEQQRIKQEEALKKKLLIEESRREAMNVAFSTIDGFSLLLQKDIRGFQSDKNIHHAFNSSKLFWIRLEYDVWGIAFPPMSDKFFTVRRLYVSEQKYFSLVVNTFTSREHKMAAGHKVANYSSETEIMRDANLQAVLTRAEVLVSQHTSKYTNTSIKSNRDKPRHATSKQVKFVKAKVVTKAKQLYSNWSSEMDTKLDTELNAFTQYRMSDLIFAIKYSKNSLWFRWELQKLLGYPDKEKRLIDKISKKDENDVDIGFNQESPKRIQTTSAQ
ncbi:putative ATP-dependent helicase Irc3p [[Candida] railenensis]|uniref:ATP-dependent helicase Irc3p n=1 Tax=[Candida] railenensis TaxID=45579 RepID=A0A9P0VZZ0_9ASCO|nr:putative ATP-dependent helicase Irc3p [[Candida] railenensis]